MFDFFVKIYEEIRPIIMNDQDILNSAFARLGGIKLISEKYNYTRIVKVNHKDIRKRKILNFLGLYRKEKELFYIKHFCGSNIKPWKYKINNKNFLFWYYAQFSPFYEQILEENNLKK